MNLKKHPCPICGKIVKGNMTCGPGCHSEYQSRIQLYFKTNVALHPLVRQAMNVLKWPTYVRPAYVVKEIIVPPELEYLPVQNLIICTSLVLRSLGYEHQGNRYFTRLKLPILLFKPEHVDPILSREDDPTHKTRTRRRWRYQRARKGTLMACATRLFTRDRFAVIKMLDVFLQPLGAMTEEDAKAEGGYTLETYRQKWEDLYGHWNPRETVFVLKFERYMTPGPLRDRKENREITSPQTRRC